MRAMSDVVPHYMAQPAKLPMWRTVFASWRFPLAHWRGLARLGWLPLLLLLAAGQLFGSFEAAPAANEDIAPVIVTGLLGALVQGAIAVIFLVAWHRQVMAEYGDTTRQEEPLSGITRRASLYFLQMLLLSLLFLVIWGAAFMAIVVPGNFAYYVIATYVIVAGNMFEQISREETALVLIGFFSLIVGLIPAFYVTLRLSLALPATATAEQRGRFGNSWRASAGNGWRMVGATLLAMLPVEFFNLGVGYFARENGDSALYYPLVLLSALGMLYLMAVMGTVLSRCFAFAESAVPQERVATSQMAVTA